MKKRLIFSLVALFLLILSKGAGAADQTAKSCACADIKTAINKCIATGGGTVNIPACTQPDLWQSDDYLEYETDVPIRLLGAGKDVTIIGYADGAAPSYRPMIYFGGSGLREIGNMTLRASDTAIVELAIGLYSVSTPSLRIHHIKFQKFGSRFAGANINMCQNPTGQTVIDHNDFGDQKSEGVYCVYVVGTNKQADYKIPASFGINNPKAVFIEDNVFDNCYHSVSGFAGSNIVLRHNIVRNMTSFVDGHGPCYDVGCRRDARPNSGTYIYEIYNNDFYRGDWCVNLRGGTGIITDNIFHGCNPGFRMEMENCSPGSDCTVAKGCPHSNTDTSKCYQSPYQYWIWNNTCDGCGSQVGTSGHQCIRENYEYFLRAPRGGDPVTSYTKYPYPHPLVSGSTDRQQPKLPKKSE